MVFNSFENCSTTTTKMVSHYYYLRCSSNYYLEKVTSLDSCILDFTIRIGFDKTVTNDYLLDPRDVSLHIYDQWQHQQKNHDDLYVHFKVNTLF